MERRIFDGSVELRGDGDEPRKIAGMGAVFFRGDDSGTEYQLFDDIVERIMPTAFDRVLSESHDVRGLFNHDASFVLGRTASGTMRLAKNERGLFYEITPPDTQQARDVVELLRRGDVSGSSFSFVAKPAGVSWRETDELMIREVRDVDLFDVGPVTFPAYESASSGLRRMDRRSLLNEADEYIERTKMRSKRYYAARLRLRKAKAT